MASQPGLGELMDDGYPTIQSNLNSSSDSKSKFSECPINRHNAKTVITSPVDTLPNGIRQIAQILNGLLGLIVLVLIVLPVLTVCGMHAVFLYYIIGFTHRTGVNTQSTKKPDFDAPALRVYFARWRARLVRYEPDERGLFYKMQKVFVQFYSFFEFYLNRDNLVEYLGALEEEQGSVVAVNDGVMVTDPKIIDSLIHSGSTDKQRMVDGVEPTPMTSDYSNSTVIFENTNTPAHKEGVKLFNELLNNHFGSRIRQTDAQGNFDPVATVKHVQNECGHLVPYTAWTKAKPDEIAMFMLRTVMFLLNGIRMDEKEELNALSLLIQLGSIPGAELGCAVPPVVSFLLGGHFFERHALDCQNRWRDLYFHPRYAHLLDTIVDGSTSNIAPEDTLNQVALMLRLHLGTTVGAISRAIKEMRKGDTQQRLLDFHHRPLEFMQECLRLCTPIQLVTVGLKEEHEFVMDGKKLILPKGTPILLPLGLYNRNVSVLNNNNNDETPVHEFDLDRPSLKDIIVFNAKESMFMAGEVNEQDTPRFCPARELVLSSMYYVISRLKPDINFDAQTTIAEPTKKLRQIDSQCVRLLKLFIMLFDVLKTGQWTYTELKVPTLGPRKLKMISLPFGRDVPDADQEANTIEGKSMATNAETSTGKLMNFAVDMATAFETILIKVARIKDSFEVFDSNEDSAAFLREIGLAKILPQPNYEFPELVSDFAIRQLCFGGMFAVNLAKVDPTDEEQRADDPHLPEDCVYSVDRRILSILPVRSGYQKYGARAYFDAECNLIGIYVSYLDQYFESPNRKDKSNVDRKEPPFQDAPKQTKEQRFRDGLKRKEMAAGESNNWTHAKFVFKTTMFMSVTVIEHLMYVHYLESNASATAANSILPASHPIRRFMQPFTFGVIAVNGGAAVKLSAQWSLIHRIWALEYDGIVAALRLAEDLYSFRTAPEWFSEEIREEVGDDNYPLYDDCNAYWTVVEEYVNSYFGIYYKSDGEIERDPFLRDYYNCIASILGYPKVFTGARLRQVVTQLIVSGSGIHELVGTVQDYQGQADACGTRIQAGINTSGIQDRVLVELLVFATGVRMPMLMETDLTLSQPKKLRELADIIRITKQFKERLRDLGDAINIKNQTRIMPCLSFNPYNLETSVSV